MDVADLIRFVLTHIPLITFLLAIIIPTFSRSERTPDGYLSWLLLLAVGVDALWAGLFHVFAPERAAAFIGWTTSPFQFEIGIADIALGVMGVLSFRRSLDFKAAAVTYASLFYIGVAYGHFHQIWIAGNHAPGNAGILLALTCIRPILLVLLLLTARRSARTESSGIARQPAEGQGAG
ncbi:DUF6790 family protein [Azospirillum ramasamyi]|nr:DUF6790 family protein [Azospirillum ramasamyi]